VSEPWIHIGRVWTNGEPLLAMDSGLVDAWDSDERFDELVDLGTEATRIPVGGGFAGTIGDGSVNEVVTGLLVALPAGACRLQVRWRTAWPMRSSPAGCCRRSRCGGIAV
jgi:hypothetical protein